MADFEHRYDEEESARPSWLIEVSPEALERVSAHIAEMVRKGILPGTKAQPVRDPLGSFPFGREREYDWPVRERLHYFRDEQFPCGEAILETDGFYEELPSLLERKYPVDAPDLLAEDGVEAQSGPRDASPRTHGYGMYEPGSYEVMIHEDGTGGQI